MAVGTAQVASREEHRAGDPTGEVQQRKLPQPAYFHGDPLLSDTVNYSQYTMRYGRCQDKAQDIVAFSKKDPVFRGNDEDSPQDSKSRANGLPACPAESLTTISVYRRTDCESMRKCANHDFLKHYTNKNGEFRGFCGL